VVLVQFFLPSVLIVKKSIGVIKIVGTRMTIDEWVEMMNNESVGIFK
jgi:hypothetical protein